MFKKLKTRKTREWLKAQDKLRKAVESIVDVTNDIERAKLNNDALSLKICASKMHKSVKKIQDEGVVETLSGWSDLGTSDVNWSFLWVLNEDVLPHIAQFVTDLDKTWSEVKTSAVSNLYAADVHVTGFELSYYGGEKVVRVLRDACRKYEGMLLAGVADSMLGIRRYESGF